MAPLIVLAVMVLLTRLIGHLGVAHFRDWAASTRVGLAVMLCFTAAAHFNRVLFIGLLWWSSVRPHRARNDAPHTPAPGRRVA